MSAELLNDDDVEISELDDLVSDMLLIAASEPPDRIRTRCSMGDRQAVERYLEEKLLRQQIMDPLFDEEYH